MNSRRIVPAFALVIAALVIPAQEAQATSVLQFGKIQYNAPGTDTHSNTSVNGEYFSVKNKSAVTKDLYGITVRDLQSHVYRFTTHFKLGAYGWVRVHTGKGTNTAHDRYWGLGWMVWNNTGDKATMKTAAGTTLDTCSWGSSGLGYTSCP
jgi:hypothetical protein